MHDAYFLFHDLLCDKKKRVLVRKSLLPNYEKKLFNNLTVIFEIYV